MFVYYIFSRILFNNKIFKSETFKKYKDIFDKQKRQIDTDTIRHIFTFELLKEKKDAPSKVCVIGDGKCNFVIGNLLTFPSSQIFSINLTETLINDYLVLKSMKILDDKQIQIIKNKEDKILKNKKLILIPSHLKDFLFNKNIDLFVNIASFQEMTINQIDQYFKVIKSNNPLLYCCNREYKKLVGGEEIYFDKYPWGYGSKIILEDCAWTQKFFQLRPPFIKKYDGNVKHCLIDYSK